MKNNMNKLRESLDSEEFIDEGQSISDFYSPFITESHTDRFICRTIKSPKNEKSQKTEKNKEI